MSDSTRYLNRIAQLTSNGNGHSNGHANGSIISTVTEGGVDPTAVRRDATHYQGKLSRLTGKAPPPEKFGLYELYSGIMDHCREMIEERIHSGISEIVEAIHDSVREQIQEAFTAALAEMVRFVDQELESRIGEHFDSHEPLTRDKLENRLHQVFAGVDERISDIFEAIAALADNAEADQAELLHQQGQVKSLTDMLRPLG